MHITSYLNSLKKEKKVIYIISYLYKAFISCFQDQTYALHGCKKKTAASEGVFSVLHFTHCYPAKSIKANTLTWRKWRVFSLRASLMLPPQLQLEPH